MGLGDGEHGHETTVAPAGDADAIGINWIFREDGVDAGENVPQVAVSEIFAVGLREGLALTVAAARIGHEDEVAERRKSGGADAARAAVPTGEDSRSRAAVNLDEERILFRGIVILGQQEPALNVEVIVLP